MKALSQKEASLVKGFLKDAIPLQGKGVSGLSAVLASSDPLVKANKVRQIRGTRCLAEYFDELGNCVRLCNDGITRQLIGKSEISGR